MASANSIAYDRTLRRMFMMRLVESLGEERDGFRASLVVNARTGLAPRLYEASAAGPASRLTSAGPAKSAHAPASPFRDTTVDRASRSASPRTSMSAI